MPTHSIYAIVRCACHTTILMCRQPYQVHLHVILNFWYECDGVRFLSAKIFDAHCIAGSIYLRLSMSLTRPPREASKNHQQRCHTYQFHLLISFGLLNISAHSNWRFPRDTTLRCTQNRFVQPYGWLVHSFSFSSESTIKLQTLFKTLLSEVEQSLAEMCVRLANFEIFAKLMFGLFESFDLCRVRLFDHIICRARSKKRRKCQTNVTETSDVSPHA